MGQRASHRRNRLYPGFPFPPGAKRSAVVTPIPFSKIIRGRTGTRYEAMDGKLRSGLRSRFTTMQLAVINDRTLEILLNATQFRPYFDKNSCIASTSAASSFKAGALPISNPPRFGTAPFANRLFNN